MLPDLFWVVCCLLYKELVNALKNTDVSAATLSRVVELRLDQLFENYSCVYSSGNLVLNLPLLERQTVDFTHRHAYLNFMKY